MRAPRPGWEGSAIQINLSFDQSTGGLPPEFVSTVSYAAALFSNIFTNSITLSIDVGYGEIKGVGLQSTFLGESEATPLGWQYPDYGTIKSALTSIDPNLVLPSAVPSGIGSYAVPLAEAKALGLASPGPSVLGPDGYVGFSASEPFSYGLANPSTSQFDLLTTVEHEISEVMGRYSYPSQSSSPGVLDLFRYNQFTLGTSSPSLSLNPATPSYFSTDGGTQDLGNYNDISRLDAGDWASYDDPARDNLGGDAFDAAFQAGVPVEMSSVDFQEMQALGYTTANTVIGQGTNIAANNDLDAFLRSNGNQLGSMEVSGTNGTTATTVWFNNPNGAALTIGSTATVVSTGTNALGAGGQDVVLGDAFGVSSTYELTSAGTVIAASVTGGGGPDYLQLFGNGTMAGGAGGNALDASAAIAGTQQLIVSTANDTIWAGAGAMTVSGSTGNGQLVYGNFVSPGSMVVSVGGGALVNIGHTSATVFAGSGSLDYGNISSVNDSSLVVQGPMASTVNPGISDTTVNGGANDLIYGSFGRASRLVMTNVSGSVMNAGLSSASVLGGTGNLVYGDFSGSSSVVLSGVGSSTIAAGHGTLSFDGGDGNTLYGDFSGTSSDTLVATVGSGNSVYGAVGAATITATGTADLIYGSFGSNAGPLVVSVTGGNNTVYAGNAAATVSGVGDSAGNSFVGGSGAQDLIAGNANDLLFAGSGNTTLTGGGGSDVFVFLNGLAGGHVMVNDFTSHDSTFFEGYGGSEVTYAFGHETVGAGSTTLALSDGTQVTFVGVTSLNQSQFAAG